MTNKQTTTAELNAKLPKITWKCWAANPAVLDAVFCHWEQQESCLSALGRRRATRTAPAVTHRLTNNSPGWRRSLYHMFLSFSVKIISAGSFVLIENACFNSAVFCLRPASLNISCFENCCYESSIITWLIHTRIAKHQLWSDCDSVIFSPRTFVCIGAGPVREDFFLRKTETPAINPTSIQSVCWFKCAKSQIEEMWLLFFSIYQ